MATQRLKAFFVNSSFALATLLAASIFLAPVNGFSSGADDVCDDMECNSFFAPEIINRPEESPFFRSWHTFYLYQDDASFEKLGDINAINIKEWKSYFEKSLNDSKVEHLVYKMPLAELNLLIKSLQGAAVVLDAKTVAIKNAFVAWGKTEKVKNSLAYLTIAKQVEPLATRRLNRDSWDASNIPADIAADLAEANRLIGVVKAMLPALAKKDAFLANRYRLQTIRLYYYSAQHSDAQAFYNSEKKAFAQEDSAKYRFMETAAGSFYRDKKYGMANYIYSRIFDSFLPMKRAAYFSFHPMEQKDWEETLALAKTNREREVLWQLLGIYHDGLTAMGKIFALNSKSDLLPLLLVREVNIAEENWSSNQDRIKNAVDTTTGGIMTDLQTVGDKRLAVIKEIADSEKISTPYLWHMSLGHLYALAGDYKNADYYLDLAGDSVPHTLINKKDILSQIRMSVLFTQLRKMQGVDKNQENHLAAELNWLHSYQSDQKFRAKTLNAWILERLSKFYIAQGDLLRGLMLKDSAESAFYRDVAQIDSMLKFINQTEMTDFDRFLMSNTKYGYDHLHELKGLNYLYAGQFSEALKAFEQAPPQVYSTVLNADPFMIHITDCHDCDFVAPHTLYTKVTFITRMKELALAAQGTGPAAAQASFELANGYYNMSYYGNGRDIYNTEFGNLRPNMWNAASLPNEKTLNMDLAEKYYVQAMEKSTDREFKTKVCFMAAKAEQNRYYYTHPDENTGVDIHPGIYFKKLKENFGDTQYYQEIINECGYFKKYATGSN